jgi:7-keto-8-aminopelargonate synthetase-like enzyme
VLNFVAIITWLRISPAVKNAAKRAIDQYGLGAASSPIMGGTLAFTKTAEGIDKIYGFGSD